MAEAHQEDPPEATPRELKAWISYDWANSVISSVVISLFAPVLLVRLAARSLIPQHLFYAMRDAAHTA